MRPCGSFPVHGDSPPTTYRTSLSIDGFGSTANEERIVDSLIRRGPLDSLMRNPSVEEVFVNSPGEVATIQRGRKGARA